MYAYMHNAVHTVADGFLFPWNHDLGLEQALQAGYRALELDVGACADDAGNSKVALYHGFCGLGTRDPATVFNAIGDFVAQNPSEIVILFLQMPDRDVVSLAALHTILQSTSLAQKLYAHTAGTPWPTLGELVDAQENIILFYFNQPSCDDQPCPTAAWHYWFDYGMETDYDFSSVADVDDTDTSCTPRFATQPRDFYRVNSFVTLPSRTAAQTLNTPEYAAARTTACAALAGQPANFYAVDYWNQGAVPRFVQDENKARAAAL